MGEIADDMVCGLSCSWCGIYFEEEHGYPVICNNCFDDFKEQDYTTTENEMKNRLLEKHGIQVTIIKELGD